MIFYKLINDTGKTQIAKITCISWKEEYLRNNDGFMSFDDEEKALETMKVLAKHEKIGILHE